MRQRLIAFAAALLLTGCAGTNAPEPSQRFKEGRDAYLAGDYSAAFERLILEAEAGNPEAQYTIGYMYHEGQGVTRDADRALSWIQRAANNGSGHALEALGELAAMGSGRPGVADAPDTTAGSTEQVPEAGIREALPDELTDAP